MKNDSISFDANTRALVIGLGRSGRASVTVLRRRGVQIVATDESLDALGDAAANLTETGAEFIAPHDLAGQLATIDVAVVSPGVPMTSPVVSQVQNARIPVLSEIEVAYRLSKAPIVAVTGTKGKTTTTTLIGALFRAAGHDTYVGGNIGNPLIAETDKAPANAWVIAEVSSFQLESIRSFKPKISTILNISPDHLDRYYSMDEYAEAKYRIFANQGKHDTFVGNLDDELIVELPEGEDGTRIPCNAVWFSRHPHRRATLYVKDERIIWAPPTGDPRSIEIMPVSDIQLLGRHNVDNVLAALLIGLVAGISPEVLRKAVREFKPLHHRLQPIATIDGVTYVNDSKATNPGAVVAALEALDVPTIIIAGGKAKRTEFFAMGRAIDAHARLAILIGEGANEIAASIKSVPIRHAASLEEAVGIAREAAQSGDAVLLSPGCASFDMFTSAEHRGDLFIEAVQQMERSAR